MFKYSFTKMYLGIGAVMLLIFAYASATSPLVPEFGPRGDVDTSSRQGYWYTYQKEHYSSSPGRSPGGYGGSSSGGYSGGK